MGSFLISSCTKEEEFVPSLHIVSFINPDEPFKVQIQKTAPTLGDHSNLEIGNAFVNVKNSITLEIVKMFHQGNGIYTSDGRKPLAGFDYEIQVVVDGFPEAAATAYVPDLGDVAVILHDAGVEPDAVEFTFSPTMITSKSSNFFAYELVYENSVAVETGGGETSNGGNGAANTVNVGAEQVINTLRPVMGSVSDGGFVPVQTVNTLDVEIEEISVRIVAISSDFHEYLVSQTAEINHVHTSVLSKNSRVYTNFVGDARGIFGGFNEKTIKLVQ